MDFTISGIFSIIFGMAEIMPFTNARITRTPASMKASRLSIIACTASSSAETMFLSLYTDKAKGILTEQRFMKLTAALEQEQESNQKRLHDLAMMQSRADAQESEVRTFIKEIRRYATIEELDEAVLNRLISRILIGEVKKVDGQKVQEVRIVYNFVGEIPEIAA